MRTDLVFREPKTLFKIYFRQNEFTSNVSVTADTRTIRRSKCFIFHLCPLNLETLRMGLSHMYALSDMAL